MRSHAVTHTYSWRHWFVGCAHATAFAALLATFGFHLGNSSDPSQADGVLAGTVLALMLAGIAFAEPLATGKGMAGTSALLLAERCCQGLALTGLTLSTSALAFVPASMLHVGLPAGQTLAAVTVAATLLLFLSPWWRSRIAAAAAASRKQ